MVRSGAYSAMQRRRIVGQAAIEIVLDEDDIVFARHACDRLAARSRQDRQRRVLHRRHQEDHLRVLLRADAFEILGIEAFLVRCHQRGAPSDQPGAARDLRIGEVLEGDIVAGRGQRRDRRHHSGMGAERGNDGVGGRTERIARQPAGAGLEPALRKVPGVARNLMRMILHRARQHVGDNGALADVGRGGAVEAQLAGRRIDKARALHGGLERIRVTPLPIAAPAHRFRVRLRRSPGRARAAADRPGRPCRRSCRCHRRDRAAAAVLPRHR